MNQTEKFGRNNGTTGTTFILLGFFRHTELQILFFYMFLIIYTITIIGNSLIIVTTLSFMDICTTSVIVPKILVNFLSQDKSISYIGCAAQLYFLIFLAAAKCYLLVAMAYDRYMAICNPLRHTIMMKVLVIFTPFSLILLSYIFIISRILTMPSAKGRYKTFYTCSSYLLVVMLYRTKKVLALSYTTITPMLNPIIYSLRKKDMKRILSTMTRKVRKR
nr:PREDICTED: LOW QUALITY PROTEIN: olfactory receptor 10A5-like [Phalacrocorax carbo]